MLQTKKIVQSLKVGAVAFGLGLAQVMFAQTTPTTTTTPGTPTTALGGMLLTNIVILAFSLSLIVAGLVLTRRSKVKTH